MSWKIRSSFVLGMLPTWPSPGFVAMTRTTALSFGILVPIKKWAEMRYSLVEKKLAAVYDT